VLLLLLLLLLLPLQQVLYMSCCGMLWTAYLSYISAGGSAQ
jgi:hypothetical protein